ncbi:hypothetical protein BKA67DRAFT_386045 [Truncatella angustata]|uniref:Uncharacterized protein n=1 Tax=Truncatella angustata TaxID=152316 RepID=A0A9P8UDF7_9PEZI|nr:uncharacterized protein BKA67DRAFT_386045 [Truncatella angustata]KAH6647409.1 hypothetical protein BKA67DRAFT_386045 [Truncatella angustata]
MHGRLSSNGKPVSWNCVVRTSCRQGNMSMNPKTVHPDLQWAGRKYTDRQLRRPRDDLQRDEVLLLSQDKQSDAAEGGEIVTIPPFPFDKLPLNVQHRVFQYLLVKPGLIHCLSRLSQKNEPREDGVFPFASSGKCGFPHRFVIGNQGVSNTWTWKGSDVLYPLLVSQRWLYVGLHTFYGMNTFAFSSLGELGRFFNGIGQSRAERVAHIELMWHGSIMPRVKSRINQRTLPLNWLTRMRQLATFTVFMEEGAERRVRRKHEFPKIPEEDKFEEDWKFYDFSDRYQDYTRMSIEKINSRGPNPHWDPLNPPSTKSKGFNPRQSLMKRTAGQPNCRANRSLRTCHGMDFVYQLRGMRWVRFYEVGQNRRLVRDWSFTDDINSVATMPKSPRYAVECELANLTTPHGLNRFVPEGQDKDMVHSFYNPCAILSVCGGSDTSISENLSGADSAGSSSDTNGVPDAGSDDSSPNDGDFGDGDSGVDMMGVDEDGDPIFNLRYPDEWTDSDDYDNQYVNMEDNDATNCIIYPDESDFESGDDYDDVDLDDTLACEDGDSGVGDIYSDVETSFIDKDDTAAKYETQPTTQEEGTESHCSVFVAGAGPENDDDDDDESLFVAEDRDNTTVSPTESSHRSLSPYPSAVASMGPPPRPQAGTTVRKTITIDEAAEIIDLTGDDDDKSTGDCNATTSDRSDYADGEVIFGRAPSVASTVVKEEQWSSDEFRRRVLMIDLTGSFDQPAPQGSLKHGHGEDSDDPAEQPSAKRARTESPQA